MVGTALKEALNIRGYIFPGLTQPGLVASSILEALRGWLRALVVSRPAA
jgi:hypothetical protein